MTNKIGIIRDYNLFLGAGKTISLSVEGDRFNILKSIADISIQFDDGKASNRREGMSGHTEKYSRVTLTSEVDQAVVVCLGSGVLVDNRMSLSDSVLSVLTPTAATADTFDDVIILAGTAALVFPANPKRKSASIFSGVDNAGAVRVGFSPAVSATHGGILSNGGNAEIAVKSEIWIFNPHSDSVSISKMESEVI